MTAQTDDRRTLTRGDDDDTGSGDRPKTGGLGRDKKPAADTPVLETASSDNDTGGKKTTLGRRPRRT